LSTTSLDYYTLFDQVYTFSPMGHALMSADGEWIKVNPALCTMLGYSQEELESLTYQQVASPDEYDRNDHQVRQVLGGFSASCSLEQCFLHKNNDEIWVTFHVSVLRDESLAAPVYLCNIIDITAKKSSELKLLAIQNQYQMITGNARDIISYTTPDGICQYCSPSCYEQLSYLPEEIIGKNASTFYHPEDMNKLKFKKFSDLDVVTFRVKHKNGRYLWFEHSFRICPDSSMLA
jgi:PAS domain S-box-containing protein